MQDGREPPNDCGASSTPAVEWNTGERMLQVAHVVSARARRAAAEVVRLQHLGQDRQRSAWPLPDVGVAAAALAQVHAQRLKSGQPKHVPPPGLAAAVT